MAYLSVPKKALVLRLWISLALILVGFLIAKDVGHVAGKLHAIVTRNRLTIAVTEHLSRHAPKQLYEFEQELLFYFALAPYFFAAGGVAGLTLPIRHAQYGILVPASYTIWLSYLVTELSRPLGLGWFDFVDVTLANCALVPIYLLGVNIGNGVMARRSPRWTLWDLMVVTLLSGLLAFAIMRRPYLAVPGSIFIIATYLVWRTMPPRPLSNADRNQKSIKGA